MLNRGPMDLFIHNIVELIYFCKQGSAGKSSSSLQAKIIMCLVVKKTSSSLLLTWLASGPVACCLHQLPACCLSLLLPNG